MLLDLSLPKVPGLEVLREIKADRLARKTRIIILTASEADPQMREALRLGAEAYLVKPVDFHQFSSVTPRLEFSWTLQPQPKGS